MNWEGFISLFSCLVIVSCIRPYQHPNDLESLALIQELEADPTLAIRNAHFALSRNLNKITERLEASDKTPADSKQAAIDSDSCHHDFLILLNQLRLNHFGGDWNALVKIFRQSIDVHALPKVKPPNFHDVDEIAYIDALLLDRKAIEDARKSDPMPNLQEIVRAILDNPNSDLQKIYRPPSDLQSYSVSDTGNVEASLYELDSIQQHNRALLEAQLATAETYLEPIINKYLSRDFFSYLIAVNTYRKQYMSADWTSFIEQIMTINGWRVPANKSSVGLTFIERKEMFGIPTEKFMDALTADRKRVEDIYFGQYSNDAERNAALAAAVEDICKDIPPIAVNDANRNEINIPINTPKPPLSNKLESSSPKTLSLIPIILCVLIIPAFLL